MARAVKAEDPGATNLINFEADGLPPLFHQFDMPSWEDLIQQWRPLYDEIGLDIYPNRAQALPLRVDQLTYRIQNASLLSNASGLPSAPVWVMETSAPVLHNVSQPHPAIFDFTEQSQADYMKSAITTTADAGVYSYVMRMSPCYNAAVRLPTGARGFMAFGGW